MKNNKIKNRLIFFSIFFAVITLMFISHIRSNYIMELKGCDDGIINLNTSENHLIAVTVSKQLYLWDWDNLNQPPQKSSVNAADLLYIGNKKLLWIPSGKPDTAVISNLKGNEVIKTLLLGDNYRQMKISESGKFVVFLSLDNTDYSSQVQLKMLDVNSYELIPASISLNNDRIRINNAAISNDGRFLGLVGSKNNAGWVCLIDIQNEKILWQKQVDWSNLLTAVIFSPGENKIYCSGNGIQVSCFDYSGQTIKSWKRSDYEIPPNKTKSMSALAISQNGKLLAAASNPTSEVWMWNTTIDNFKPLVIDVDNTYVTSLAFSPGTDKLTTTSFKVIDKTHIWKLKGISK